MRRWPRPARWRTMARAPPWLSTLIESKEVPSTRQLSSRIGSVSGRLASSVCASTAGDMTIRPSTQPRIDLGAVVVGAGDQQVIAAAVGGRVDAAHHLGEELAVEIGEQHADGVGLVGDQAAGGAVGGVAQPLGDLEDAAAGLGTDRPLVVEHPRDGRDRDLGLPRDLLDRGAHPRAPPGCRDRNVRTPSLYRFTAVLAGLPM